jgi:hypothetical protein
MNKAIKLMLSFNTGRQYSDAGQLINVFVMSDNTIYFQDDTRNLNGILDSKEVYSDIQSLKVFRGRFMQEYDAGNYTYPHQISEREILETIAHLEHLLTA